MRQIIFFSTAAEQQDVLIIADIVAASYRHNAPDGITGLLVAGGHRYLQIVEGAEDVAHSTLARIRRDRRHVGLTVLVDRIVARRSFASWSVIFEGEPEFGNFATLADMIKLMRKHVQDREVKAQLDGFAHQFVIAPLPPPPSPWTMAPKYCEKSALDCRH